MRFKTVIAASIGATVLALMAFFGSGGTAVAQVEPVGISDVLHAEVLENLAVRVQTNYHTTKGPWAPDTVEVTEAGSVVATYEEIRLGEPPAEFRFYFDGDLDSRVAKSAPFLVAIPPQSDSMIGMTYKITVEFGLGEPYIVVTPGRQVWYWGQACHWDGCNEVGEGPFPPGGWHAQIKYQTVPPAAFGPHLLGCNVLIKNPDAPLECGEAGWTPPTLEE